MSADGGDGNVLAGPWQSPIEEDLYARHEVDYEIKTSDMPPSPNSPAWEILQEAANLIEGDRNEQHGPREKCHAEIAKLWTWWTGFQVDAFDVAMMMMLLKAARTKTGGANRDNFIDLCGYASIAGELRDGRGS